MEKLNLIAIGITLSIVLFKWLDWARMWKLIFKIPLHKYHKPIDCFRCNIFWVTQIVGLFLLPDWGQFIYFTFINFVTSHIIDKID